MKKLDGWQRLWVILTALWVSGLVSYTVYEWHAVLRGDSPTMFVVLRDAKTQEEFGRLSIAEVKELGKLTHERSLSPMTESGDAKAAKALLAANPEPALRYFQIAMWLLLPVVCFWAFFVSVRWVAAGFRRPNP